MGKIIAVTNRKLCSRPFLEQVERVAKMSPDFIILREKDLPEKEYEILAEKVQTICRDYQVELVLHHYPAVAKRMGIPAVHLSLPRLREYADAKEKAGIKIGCSVHSLEEAKEAERLGAAYLTAGHIYATDCKRGLPPRGLEFLSEVCDGVNIPVYAIGGIGLSDGRMAEVLDAGAEGVCIMSAFMNCGSCKATEQFE